MKETVEKSRWENTEGVKVEIIIHIPKILETYSKYMGGIDRFDQKCAYYSFLHRSRR